MHGLRIAAAVIALLVGGASIALAGGATVTTIQSSGAAFASSSGGTGTVSGNSFVSGPQSTDTTRPLGGPRPRWYGDHRQRGDRECVFFGQRDDESLPVTV